MDLYTYNFPSSDETTTHVVTVFHEKEKGWQSDVFTCTCPSSKFRKGNCKHVKSVISALLASKMDYENAKPK